MPLLPRSERPRRTFDAIVDAHWEAAIWCPTITATPGRPGRRRGDRPRPEPPRLRVAGDGRFRPGRPARRGTRRSTRCFPRSKPLPRKATQELMNLLDAVAILRDGIGIRDLSLACAVIFVSMVTEPSSRRCGRSAAPRADHHRWDDFWERTAARRRTWAAVAAAVLTEGAWNGPLAIDWGLPVQRRRGCWRSTTAGSPPGR